MAKQQDAIRRVNEMQRISQEKIRNQARAMEKHEQTAPATRHATSFKIDNEKLLLIALIVFLISEGADTMLIIALVYILL
jgi:hypothetical protein